MGGQRSKEAHRIEIDGFKLQSLAGVEVKHISSKPLTRVQRTGAASGPPASRDSSVRSPEYQAWAHYTQQGRSPQEPEDPSLSSLRTAARPTSQPQPQPQQPQPQQPRGGQHQHRPQGQRRCISRCANISNVYRLGGRLMPSYHRNMELRTAVRWGGAEEVAVKIRWKQGFRRRSEEKSWRANMEMLLNLPQSGAARVYEVLEDKSAYYVIMEKAAGKDLFETLRLQRDGRLPLAEANDVLRQLLQAVQSLHAAGCIHKDLKLENVVLDRSCSAAAPSQAFTSSSSPTSPRAEAVKIVDFDTVEVWNPDSPPAKDIVGTDQYIAPEAYGGRYSPASDIFAVGVIAYKLFSGDFPFPRTIFNDVPGDNWVGSPKMVEIKGKLENHRVDWRHAVFSANPGLQQLIARMLAANEHRRPRAQELLADAWFSTSKPAVVKALGMQPRGTALFQLPHSVGEAN